MNLCRMSAFALKLIGIVSLILGSSSKPFVLPLSAQESAVSPTPQQGLYKITGSGLTVRPSVKLSLKKWHVPSGSHIRIIGFVDRNRPNRGITAKVTGPDLPECSESDPCYTPYHPLNFTLIEETGAVETIEQTQDAINDLARINDECKDNNLITKMEGPTPDSQEEFSLFKTIEDMQHWMTCFEKKSEFTKAYQDKYQHYIKIASEAFEPLPEHLMSCLMFQESRWDEKARNEDSGAYGLGQFLPVAIDTVNNIVPMWTTKADTIKGLEDTIRINASLRDAGKPYREDYLVYANSRTGNIKLSFKWKSYFEKMRENGYYKNSIPTNFSRYGAGIPQNAVAGSALYLLWIHRKLSESLEFADDPDELMKDPDYLAVLGGAYNLGHGDAIKALQNVRPATPEAWLQQLQTDTLKGPKKNAEVLDYTTTISRCLKKDNWSPPRVDANLTCEAPK